MDAPAPCASTNVLWSCTVYCKKEQTTKEHICVGPSFFIFRHLSLCERSKSSPTQTLQPCPPPTETSVPFRCVYCVCHFSLFDQQRCWIDVLDSCYATFPTTFPHSFPLCSSPPHPSFLFEPIPRFDYRSKKIHMQLEERRFQRNLYLRVIGMWQGVRQEAGSSHTTYDSEEEGVGGPPAQALGERE